MQSQRAQRRQQVLDAALNVIDREGLQRLTIRRLCDELGMSAPVVYKHFADKDEIIGGLLQRIVESEPAARRTDEPPRPWLTRCLRHMRESWLAHPGLMAMMTSSEPMRSEALALAEHILTALRETGLDERQAGGAFHSLMSYMLGSVALARGSATARLTAHTNAQPEMARCAPYMDAREDAVFERGLQQLLDAVLPGPGSTASVT